MLSSVTEDDATATTVTTSLVTPEESVSLSLVAILLNIEQLFLVSEIIFDLA